jgi:hypothetical protein
MICKSRAFCSVSLTVSKRRWELEIKGSVYYSVLCCQTVQ